MNNNIVNINESEEARVITLKEIVDVLNAERKQKIQHSKAMKLVAEMAKIKDFGQVEKNATCSKRGNGATVKIETYHLTKKQALMVGARLDNKRVIYIVNKLEELTKQLSNAMPIRIPDKRELLLEQIKLLDEIEKKDKTIDNLMHTDNTYTTTQIAKELGMSAQILNKILHHKKVIYKSNGTWVLYAKYQNFSLMRIREKEINKPNKKYATTSEWTLKGKNWLLEHTDRLLETKKELGL